MDTLSLHASAPGQRSPTKQYPFERAAADGKRATIHPFERRKSFEAPIVVELPELPEAREEGQIYETSEPADVYTARETQEQPEAYEAAAPSRSDDEQVIAWEHDLVPVDAAYERPVPIEVELEPEEEQAVTAEPKTEVGPAPVDAWEAPAEVEAEAAASVEDDAPVASAEVEAVAYAPVEEPVYAPVEEHAAPAPVEEHETAAVVDAYETAAIPAPEPAVEPVPAHGWYEEAAPIDVEPEVEPEEAEASTPIAEEPQPVAEAPEPEPQAVAHPFAGSEPEPVLADGWVQETVPLEQLEFAERRVIVRLSNGEPLEVAAAPTATEAIEAARQVVQHIGDAEAAGEWPELAGRYIRPDTIVSVDIQVVG